MIFLIVDRDRPDNVILVKADNEQLVRDRLVFRDGEYVVGRITDPELQALTHSAFCVIVG